jgi:hypothetical protein
LLKSTSEVVLFLISLAGSFSSFKNILELK